MNPIFLFAIQFIWFLVIWFTIANLFIVPKIKGLEQNDQLIVWLSPQLFRVLGLGLLVENLAPSLPLSFALPTAIGDSLTAVLAFVSIIALNQRWPSARSWILVCNVVGSLDLAIALPHAVTSQAAIYLTGQWYVAAAILPLMIVSHALTWRTILRHRS